MRYCSQRTGQIMSSRTGGHLALTIPFGTDMVVGKEKEVGRRGFIEAPIIWEPGDSRDDIYHHEYGDPEADIELSKLDPFREVLTHAHGKKPGDRRHMSLENQDLPTHGFKITSSGASVSTI